MTLSTSNRYQRIRVRLGDLDVAPENPRFGEAADAGIPRLADTIRAAGLLYPPIVRRGRKDEQPFLALAGRRRRLALLHLVEAGDLTLDSEVEADLAVDKAAQAAALLTETETLPAHTADIIVAIGKLRRARMNTAAIAAALGYQELEIRRLAALSTVHETVLTAFRAGKLNLRQVRLFARLKNPARQAKIAQTALDGYFHDYQLRDLVQSGKVTVEDEAFALVGAARYAEAGGQIETDLFGELPDVVLDRDLLAALWRARAAAVAAGLASAGLSVHLGEDRGYRAPEGLLTMPYVHVGSMPAPRREAFDAARSRVEIAADAVGAAGPADAAADAGLAEMLDALLAAARAKLSEGTVAAVLLAPNRALGVEASFYWRPPEIVAAEAEAQEDHHDHDDDDDDAVRRPDGRHAEAPDVSVPPVEVEVDGVGHGLHEVRTDLATRGLIRGLADSPEAALIAVVAQLFKAVALQGSASRETSALAILAIPYRFPIRPDVAELDGEVRQRLVARRDAYRGSGLRPIAWVASLAADDRLALLAELAAMTLDLREPRTSAIRPSARADAREIAVLCEADLARHWTPDAPYLTAHSKAQLLAMADEMGVEDDRLERLKKEDLVAAIAGQAAERRWTPAVVGWAAPETEPAEAGADNDRPSQADVSAAAGADRAGGVCVDAEGGLNGEAPEELEAPIAPGDQDEREPTAQAA